MYPEKEIINFWLNRNGFYTVNSIPAGKNKEIEILAIRFKQNSVEKVQHIEISCSVSPTDNMSLRDYEEKYNDKLIVARIKQYLTDTIGMEVPYEKVLIVGHSRLYEQLMNMPEITVLKFGDILFEVMKNLSRQSYRSETIRTLQLIKFLLMSSPAQLASLLQMEDKGKFLKKKSREEFLNELLQQDNVKKILDKEFYEQHIVELLKNSSLNRPEKLAQVLATEVVGSRSRSKFIKKFMEASKVKVHKPKKKQKPLMYYLKK